MSSLADLPARLARGVLRITLALALAVFLVSLLLASLVVVLGVSLWSLLTGRQPAPVVMFNRMRERSRQMAQGVWPAQPGAPRGDVVDVQAREVEEGGGPRQS